MGKSHNVVAIIVVTLCIWLMPLHGHCQENISKGLQWLISVQNADGSWGNWAGPVLRDTTAVADTLQILSPSSSAYSTALQWLATTSPVNNDDVSRRLFTFSKTTYDTSPDLNYLMTGRKSNGGWGLDLDHESDSLDTSLALQSLKTVNYSDQNVIQAAISYLLTTQNPDGGWGFYPSTCSGCNDGDDSNVYMTALVSYTLQQFPQTTSLATAVNKATSYILTQQQTNGSWGSVYETALAYIALVGVTTDNTVLGNAINYLLSTQSPDGSWNDDPYSTALQKTLDKRRGGGSV